MIIHDFAQITSEFGHVVLVQDAEALKTIADLLVKRWGMLFYKSKRVTSKNHRAYFAQVYIGQDKALRVILVKDYDPQMPNLLISVNTKQKLRIKTIVFDDGHTRLLTPERLIALLNSQG